MRFKDFKIVINGDFASHEDEQDLRSTIAGKLSDTFNQVSSKQPSIQMPPAITPGLTPEEAEEETIERIEDGTARWSPPLQQHLDVVKQSLMQNFPVTEDQSADSLKDVSKKIAESVGICERCSSLVFGSYITENIDENRYKKIQSGWRRVMERYVNCRPKCTDRGKPCKIK